MVRARALTNSLGTSRAAKGNFFSLNHLNQGRSTQSCDGDQGNQIASDFQFTATVCPEMAVQFEGRDCRSESELKQGLTGMEVATMELNRIDSVENEATRVIIGGEVAGSTKSFESLGVQTHGGTGQPPGGFARDGIRRFEIGGDARVTEAERMDLEGGGDAVAGL